MGSIRDFFKDAARIVGTIEDARDAGETDPLRLLDAITQGGYTRTPDAQPWWELFGLDERPGSKAELRAAWSRWAARNHPDKGAPEPAFRHMRGLFEAKLTTLPD